MSTNPSSLSDLLAQRAALEQQIHQMQSQQRAEALTKIRTLMSEFGLTMADLGAGHYRSASSGSARRAGTGSVVAPKFRNAVTGETWSGRGLQPKWLKAALESGKKLADFAVDGGLAAAAVAQASVPKANISNAAADVASQIKADEASKKDEHKKEEAKPAAAAAPASTIAAKPAAAQASTTAVKK